MIFVEEKRKKVIEYHELVNKKRIGSLLFLPMLRSKTGTKVFSKVFPEEIFEKLFFRMRLNNASSQVLMSSLEFKCLKHFM